MSVFKSKKGSFPFLKVYRLPNCSPILHGIGFAHFVCQYVDQAAKVWWKNLRTDRERENMPLIVMLRYFRGETLAKGMNTWMDEGLIYWTVRNNSAVCNT